jgi:NADH dehydrogenase
VELAGALAEIARYTLAHDFRHIDPTDAHIMIADGGERVLAAFPPELSARALEDLKRLRVEVRLHTVVSNVAEGQVTLTHNGQGETIDCYNVLWAAGVQASPLGRKLATATGDDVDRAGRLKVMPDCTVPNHPEIFVVGDMANCPGADGKPLPGVAQVAMQQAKFAARVIKDRLAGREPPAVFRYRDYGIMATIGRGAAVAQIGKKWRFKGFLAWLMWLFVHVMQLVQFSSRIAVLWQWGYSYLTYNRSARLITGKTLPVKTKVAAVLSPAASIGDPGAADTDHQIAPLGSPAPGEPGSRTEQRVETVHAGR